MLYIEKGEKAKLPSQYRQTNNLCAIIYDQLTEILVQEYYEELEKTTVLLDDKSINLIKELESGNVHALDWLAKNKLDKELTVVLTKHIMLSVLSDFVDFIYESLNCAKKGKFSVAYALLRKPLTDELLIFEQILYDKEDFIRRFYHEGSSINYDPSNPKIDKKTIIKNAFTVLSPKWFFTEELIYQLRYDKSCDSGINGISNLALHIVTQDRNYKTNDQDLNFVFSRSEENYKNFFSHYYYFVPYLLIYAVTIIDQIIFDLLPGSELEGVKPVKAFKRFIALLLWTEQTKTHTKKNNNKLIEKIKEILQFECHNCNHVNLLKRPDYELFFETDLILCEKCGENILISFESIKPIIDFLKHIK
jgi:hypothetical protein